VSRNSQECVTKNPRNSSKKDKKKKFKFKHYFWGIIIFLICGFLISGFLWLTNPKTIWFPVQTVVIKGDLKRLNQDDIKQLIAPYVHQGFFHVDLKAIQKVLQDIPVVSKALVRRIWPNKIVILLIDQNIVGYWNDHAVINRYGEKFHLDDNMRFGELPQLIAPKGFETEALEDYQKTQQLLQSRKLFVTKLTLTPNHFLSIKLNTGTHIDLGYQRALDRLNKFVMLYPRMMKGRRRPPKSVDMCYEHGMAVRW